MDYSKELPYNYYLKKILTILVLFSLIILYAILPSVNNSELMQGTQSGKSFAFFYIVIVIISLSLLNHITQKDRVPVKIGWLDFGLFLYVAYVFFRNGITPETISNIRFLELIGLSFTYVIVRQLKIQNYGWIFLAIMIGGLIQAIHGNLQLWGYYPSHHGMFRMTGSFFNPGPYAGYLSSVFPIAIGFYLFKIDPFILWKNKKYNKISQYIRSFLTEVLKRIKTFFPQFILKTITKKPFTEKLQTNPKEHVIISILILLVVIFIALVLPASRSRASWLAVLVPTIFLLLVKYPVFELFKKYFNPGIKKAGVIFLGIILVGISVSGLYFIKRGSADGRLLIWKITLSMIKEKPVTGFGFDQFKSHYMDYQAAYFKQNPESKEAMVAGDTNYTFNELLQHTVELGIVGLLIIALVLIIAFQSPVIHIPKCKAPPPKTLNQENESLFKLEQINSIYQLNAISKAGIISIFVFSLFSYPAQILPIKLNLVLYFAVLAALSAGKNFSFGNIISRKNNSKFLKFIPKVLLTLIGFGLLYFGFVHTQKLKTAYVDWKSAYQVYQIGAYDACLADYEKAYPVLENNGAFLTNYGKALSMAEQHEKAFVILQLATKKYPNTVANNALGDSFKDTGQSYKAEQAYLQAWYMNPSRFYPKYLLAKLYDESGQKEKAVTIAKELLNKEIKVQSTAIEEIKEEMEKIIIKKKKGNYNTTLK